MGLLALTSPELTAINRNVLRGQTLWSSANAFRPVILSGHASYTSKACPSSDCFCDWRATRGFSNATFSRSTASDSGRMSWHSLASTVQSNPPEKRTAIRVPGDDGAMEAALGASGTLRTRRRSASMSCSLSIATGLDDGKSLVSSSTGRALLNLPMLRTYGCKCDWKPRSRLKVSLALTKSSGTFAIRSYG